MFPPRLPQTAGLRALVIGLVPLVLAPGASARQSTASEVVAGADTGPTGIAAPSPPAPATLSGSQPASLDNPHTGFRTLFRDVVQDFRHLPSRDSLLWLGIGGGLAGLSVPLDDDLNDRLAGRGGVDAFFTPGKVTGYGAVQIGAAVGTWVVGRATDKRGRVAHLGLDLLRAQIVTQTITYGLKYATRRERPDGSDHHSFPSGHASTTFASATVLQRHLGWRYAVPTYAVATYVAASRLHENRHHLSDVIFGGAVGLIAGRTVTRHGRANYAWLPLPVPGGMGIQVARIGN